MTNLKIRKPPTPTLGSSLVSYTYFLFFIALITTNSLCMYKCTYSQVYCLFCPGPNESQNITLFCTLFESQDLKQALKNLSSKGPESIVQALRVNQSLLHLFNSAAVAQRSHTLYASEWAWLCSHKPLLTKTGGGLDLS